MTRAKTILRLIKVFSIGIFSCFCVVSQAQQKMQFTQYMFNGVVINPAYAGAEGALSLTAIQRTQWSGVENAPNTQTFSAHSLFKKKQFGLGLTFVNDKIGVHNSKSVMTQYAYHLSVADHSYFSFGLQAGIYNLRSDYASLGSQAYDPQISDPVMTRTFFDLGAGFYFRSPRFHAGLSAPELIPKRFTFSDTLSVHLSKVNFFIFSKYRMTASSTIDIEPSVLVKYLDGVPVSFDINANMIYRKVLVFGLSFRQKESIDFLMRMQITSQLQIGYAYDHPIGVLSRVSNGSHELMVNYTFKDIRKRVISPR